MEISKSNILFLILIILSLSIFQYDRIVSIILASILSCILIRNLYLQFVLRQRQRARNQNLSVLLSSITVPDFETLRPRRQRRAIELQPPTVSEQVDPPPSYAEAVGETNSDSDSSDIAQGIREIRQQIQTERQRLDAQFQVPEHNSDFESSYESDSPAQSQSQCRENNTTESTRRQ